MHCLPQRLKSTFFEKNSSGGFPEVHAVKKKFQKKLILFFEVIVQPPKHIFEIGIFSMFSSFCRMNPKKGILIFLFFFQNETINK